MGLFKRIFGICETLKPKDPECWRVAGKNVEIDLARAPELGEGQGAIRLEGKGLLDRILVVHGSDGSYHAFRNRCTHMGRRLDPVEGESMLRCCSVSKSTFDYAGNLISGPAKDALQTLPVENRKCKVVIRLD